MHALSAERVGWGILGTGGIAASFARDLKFVPDAGLTAVGSRLESTARDFADRFGIGHAYGSYEELVADPGVHVVYVATPQTVHAANIRLALEAGKAVLCEKPFTMTAAEARDVVQLARERELFLMEAMWTRFLPHMEWVDVLINSGEIGEVTSVVADHGQRIPTDVGHRLHQPELGGGALLDLGVYPISLASFVLGSPERINAVGSLLGNGLDAQTSVVLSYPGGAHAVLTTTLTSRTPNRATINGTHGRIEVDSWWFTPTSYSLFRDGVSVPDRFESPKIGSGLWHQAAAVCALLRQGKTESTRMPLEETVSIMATIDEVRRQIGLIFPGEPT